MTLTINTPAILFSMASLIFISFTNRYIALANLVRGLKSRYLETHDEDVMLQIENLRKRINMLKNMQFLGIGSLILSIFSVFAILFDREDFALWLFLGSLTMMLISISLAAREILISVDALDIELKSMEKEHNRTK